MCSASSLLVIIIIKRIIEEDMVKVVEVPDPESVTEIKTLFAVDHLGRTNKARISSRTTTTRIAAQYALAARFQHIFVYLTPI